jgi:hypothetical protein
MTKLSYRRNNAPMSWREYFREAELADCVNRTVVSSISTVLLQMSLRELPTSETTSLTHSVALQPWQAQVANLLPQHRSHLVAKQENITGEKQVRVLRDCDVTAVTISSSCYGYHVLFNTQSRMVVSVNVMCLVVQRMYYLTGNMWNDYVNNN